MSSWSVQVYMVFLTLASQSFNEFKIPRLDLFRVLVSMITSLLYSFPWSHHKLHWLPVKYRIVYKILLLTYKCFHGLAPDYLADLIQEYKPSRNLRSSSKRYLVSKSVATTSYGQRSFYFAAPELWNDLPYNVKYSKTLVQFKSSLKTHLFTLAFGDNWFISCLLCSFTSHAQIVCRLYCVGIVRYLFFMFKR